MLELAPRLALVLLVAFVVASANAIQVVTVDYYSRSDCTGTKTTAPFFVSGRCQGYDLTGVGGGLGNLDPNLLKQSFSYNCNGNIYSLYQGAANCSAVTPTEVSFSGCSNGAKLGCAEFSSNQIALMQLGECANSNLVRVSFEIVLLLDTCLPNDAKLQSFAIGAAYKLTKSADQTLTYTTYTDAACTQGARVAFTGKLNAGCGASGGAGRLLQGASISASFQTVPDGNGAASISTHVALSLLAAFGMLAVLF